MTRWLERLRSKRVLVTDGAWGTQLALKGLKPGTVPETWNLDQADLVLSVASSYVDAGSDIILTNTFGGHPLKLAKSGLKDKTVEINRIGVEISKKAAGDLALVFASVGSSGEFMEPLGEISEAEMIAFFAEQIQGCVAGGAHGVCIETMTDLGEAKAALKAARRICDLPVVVSMTFDKGQAGFATMMGVKPEQAARELHEAGADIIGANCGAGISDMVEVIRQMKGATDRPLWAKANAGLPALVDGKTVFRETPEDMASHLQDLLEAGANHVGGCCGTGPDHIRAMRQTLDALK